MRRWCAVGLVVLVAGAPSLAAEEITVAFWNVENLFDEHRDDEHPTGTIVPPEELRISLAKKARVIRALDADILGLCEVENQGILRRLCQEHLAGMGYAHFAVIEEQDERGIDVALVSRRPFFAKSYRAPPFVRGFLAGRFSAGGAPFYVIVNHWKSRREGGGEDLRLAASRRVADMVNRDLPGFEGRPVPVVVLGDLNDDDDNLSVRNLEKAGMTNTLKHLAPKQRWTLPYHNRGQRRVEYNGFDHILVNGPLKEGAGGVQWVANSSEVVRPAFMLRKRKIDGQDYDWPDDSYGKHIGFSDHFPVRTRLSLPGK